MSQVLCAPEAVRHLEVAAPPRKVRVVRIPGKGRGVVATETIAGGETIEICPLVILTPRDGDGAASTTEILKYYVIELTSIQRQCLMGGYGAIYNHSDTPNADVEYTAGEDTLAFRALRAIREGEEITFDYRFDDGPDFLALK